MRRQLIAYTTSSSRDLTSKSESRFVGDAWVKDHRPHVDIEGRFNQDKTCSSILFEFESVDDGQASCRLR